MSIKLVLASMTMALAVTANAGEKKEVKEEVDVQVKVVKQEGKAVKHTTVVVNGEKIDLDDKTAVSKLPKDVQKMLKKHKETGDKAHKAHKIIEIKADGEGAHFEAAMRLIKDGEFTDKQKAKLVAAIND